MKSPAYWRTDTERDAVYSLVTARDFLAVVDKQPHYWRWFVLAVHSAVQGSLALALTNGDILHVQKPGVAQRMLASLSSQGLSTPDPHMDNFLRLYAKAKDAAYLRSGATPLPAYETHARAMRSLDEMRDGFAHFNSKSWSIEIEYITGTAATACEVLEHIFGSGAVLWHHRGSAARSSRALKALKAALRARANNSSKPTPLRGAA